MQGEAKNTHQPCALLSTPMDTSGVVHHICFSYLIGIFGNMYLTAGS